MTRSHAVAGSAWLLALLFGCGPQVEGEHAAGGASGGGGTGSMTTAGTGGSAGTSAMDFDAQGHGLPGAAEGSWTYLLYMLGDNNLESFTLHDLEELMSVGSGENLTILVQLDRSDDLSHEAVGGVQEFSGVKRLRVEAGALTELEDLGELNSGASQTFEEFLTWGIQAAPADHYAVVLWDHGGAWGRFGADASHDNDGLTLPELTRAFDRAISATKLRGPLDLVGFDACLLGSWEVAVALAPRAHYMLASEELEPGHGWDQGGVALLKQGADTEALGRALIDGYAEQSRREGTYGRITLALTDLDYIDPVTQAIEALTVRLSQGGVTNHAATVGRSRAAVPVFGTMPGGATTSMVDLRLWALGLAEVDPAVQSESDALLAALDQAVVYDVAGEAYAGVGGLSIFFPLIDSGELATYDELGGVDVWREFVSDFHDAGSAATEEPTFTEPNNQAVVAQVDGGLLVSGTLTPGSVAGVTSVSIDFGLYGLDGTAYFLGQQPAEISEAGLVSALWDARVLRLTQGGVSDYASYVVESESNGVTTLSVPFQYVSGDITQIVVLGLAFDASGALVSHAYYEQIDGAWAELVPSLGSTLVPLIPTLAPSADDVDWLPRAEPFDGALEIVPDYVTLEPGTNVFVRLRAKDYAGHTDAVSNSGTL